MNVLILGGTVFLGRHLTEAALAAGHDVTLFNRGQHNADLYPDLEKLRGDRDGGLDVLKGRTWDAVVDTCGYVPRLVRDSASLLANAVDHYTFISTLSVYRDFRVRGLREEAAVGMLDDETTEAVTGGSNGTYGPLKALCEQAAEAAMPGRVLSVRPGLIVGPYDPTDRFTYWPVRVARGGEMLAPPTPQAPVQFIDARDLAEWVIRMAERNKTGIYNATGPAERLTFASFLAACNRTAGNAATFIWASPAFLAEQQVRPWRDLPLWVPDEMWGLLQVDTTKATAEGLAFRPLAETLQDTLMWAQQRPDPHEWQAGLSTEREAGLLAKWGSRSNRLS
jgi:2'-hydroxyisoflavone reductase